MEAPSTSGHTPPTLTFAVLGTLEVRQGSSVVELPGRRERALLSLLLTAPGRVFSVPAIVTGIWGDDPPDNAAKTVQVYVSRLRRSLPGGVSVLRTRSPGYVVAVKPQHIDVQRFKSLADDGRHDLKAGRPEAAVATLREALGLWRGEAYAEFDAPFAIAERTALEELRLATLEDRIAADLATGAGPELVGELEMLVEQHPWREFLWAQLMTALYRSGRQGDALAAFQRARATLVDELGIEPGPELRAVEAQVLTQDARLLGVGQAPDVFPPPPVVGPTFVGREAEMARLLDAFERAVAGSVERILLTGRHGIGKSRMLAELARAVRARGGEVIHGADQPWPVARRSPVVILLDDLQRASVAELAAMAERLVRAGPPLLVVGACAVTGQTAEHAAAVGRIFPDHLPVPRLEAADVAEIVKLYVQPEAVEEGIAAVADAAGVPLQVHAAASRFAEQLATAQVEAAAAGISTQHRQMSASRERVADGVLDLQRIRVVKAAHDQAEARTVMCPYKGLANFDVDDAPYFFGRERLVAHLVARLVDTRVLAVIGASGSGKSSVLRAGLVAALRDGRLPGSERWHVELTTPTRQPPELPRTGTRTILMIDQFEEFFTALPAAEQEGYAAWVAETAAHDDLTVVVAVRSDYFAQVADLRQLSDLIAADTVLVGDMAPDELRGAVELPAAAAGLELEPELVETILADLSGQPGALPLLSTAMLSLWERRDGRRLTLASYHEIGGVRAALTRLAESAFGQLAEHQQAMARRTLLRLAEIGESGEPVRRRVPIAEVASDGDVDARTVVDALAARRLLIVSDTHVEVAHEALLREWPRLRGWLDEDATGRRLRRHLAPAAHEWEARGRDTSELYRGPRLAAALDWQRDHPHDLTALEHDFLRTSRQAAEAEAVRRRRSIRRLRVLVAGLVGVLALAIVAGTVAVDQRDKATQASMAADVRALHAKALDENRWDRALLYAAQAHRFEPSASSRAALLQTVQRSPQATAILGADHPLQALATSQDGTKVVGSGTGGDVYIWDAETGQLSQKIDDVTAFWAESLDISPDGRYIAAVGLPVTFVEDQRPYVFHVVVVDLQQNPPTVRFLESAPASVARFTADSRTVVALDDEGAARYVDVETGAVSRTIPLQGPGPWTVLDMSVDRRFTVAAQRESPGFVSAWAVDTGQQLWSSTEAGGVVASISPDGATVVLGRASGAVEHVVLAGSARQPVPSTLTTSLVDIAWSPDGSTFAGATADRSVVLWDTRTFEPRGVLRGHWGAVTDAAYSADGTTMYASGFDRAVLSWDLTGTNGIVTEVGGRPPPGVLWTTLAPNGSVAATGYADNRVVVFDVARRQTFEVTVPGRPEWLLTDRSGRYVGVMASTDQATETFPPVVVSVIDVQRKVLLSNTAEFEPRTTFGAVFSWDGRALLTSTERRADLSDVATGRLVSSGLFEGASAVTDMAVHPDGHRVALAETDVATRAVEIVDMTSGEILATPDPGVLSGERIGLGPIFFSPDGSRLAAAGFSGRIVVWDTESWRILDVWDAVSGFRVNSLAFTPDSQFLVTSGAGAASLWSVEQGGLGGVTLEVDPLRPDAQVFAATREDGRTLVTFTEDTGVRLWSIEADRLFEHACLIARRNLTQDEWSDVLPDRPYQRTCPQYPSG